MWDSGWGTVDAVLRVCSFILLKHWIRKTSVCCYKQILYPFFSRICIKNAIHSIITLYVEFCHHVLTLKLFLLITKEDILKNCCNQLMNPIDFHTIFYLIWKSVGSILFVLSKINKFKQV